MSDRGGYVHPELLVETDWLAVRLNDPHIRIVDADVPDQYRRAHIPSAVIMRSHHYLKNPKDEVHVMTPEQLAAEVGAMGIGDDTLVIAYDNSGSLYAARFWWVLSYYGHDQVKVLNGGWNKWLAEGRPVSAVAARPAPATFTPRPTPELIASGDELRDSLGHPDMVALDVRSLAEHSGANPRQNRFGGHVPGAIHLEWTNFMTDDALRTFKPARELRAMLESRGVTPEKEVVAY